MLWMDVAFIDHQYDLSPSQHQQHHCQLFSCAHHGVNAATLSAEDMSLPDVIVVDEQYQYSALTALAYHARSPPYRS